MSLVDYEISYIGEDFCLILTLDLPEEESVVHDDNIGILGVLTGTIEELLFAERILRDENTPIGRTDLLEIAIFRSIEREIIELSIFSIQEPYEDLGNKYKFLFPREISP